ncbi:uncharacterized protein LAJ45_06960 [Morchella importuna]|uniref:uncharacterized protein n=1 Tax=Morchella importuna TaxID=1174673 RepID=UPI001E8E0100|nr:uncharacterized protein LAJ45_06960 [Morchella importuna]KAH8148985.1 hypothetical protein LAJ45_06960 [Morchella importuna]
MTAEQPNFVEIEVSMNNIVRSSMELATNLGRMRNIPALDGSAQILAELRAIGQRLDRIESRLDAADYDNAVARFMNNSVAARTDNELIPLKTQNFPMTLVDIDRTNSVELNRLLESHGLPTAGTMAARKRQLKNYLGVTIAMKTRNIDSLRES